MDPSSVAAARFVSSILVVAAIIDGRELRVPNWLTFPLALAGLLSSAVFGGVPGAMVSLGGLIAGLVPLLLVYAIGGMGAGDVKLMAAVGAWVGPVHILWAFAATVIAGGVIGAVQIALSGHHRRHVAMMHTIAGEILSIKEPVKLSEIAAARKPRMKLLPYGIPMAIGSIAYFAWAGLLS